MPLSALLPSLIIALTIVLPRSLGHDEQKKPARSGEAIYQTYCATCHGLNFEGVKAAQNGILTIEDRYNDG